MQLLTSQQAQREPIRHRRSINDEHPVFEQPLSKDISHEFRAFKQSFQLNLTEDTSFVGPYVIIQTSNTSRIAATNQWFGEHSLNISEPTANSSSGCLYVGSVNGELQHTGVANMCTAHGMVCYWL